MLCSQSCEFCMDISCDNKGTYHVASFLCNLVIHGGPMSLLCILFKFKGSFKKMFMLHMIKVHYCQLSHMRCKDSWPVVTERG